MSIREIIESATPGPWEMRTPIGETLRVGVKDSYPAGLICKMYNNHRSAQDFSFITTFDPEHVALMEAVILAANNSALYDEGPSAFGKSKLMAIDALGDTADSLIEYRKERGLL